jgi:hypothetical protein
MHRCTYKSLSLGDHLSGQYVVAHLDDWIGSLSDMLVQGMDKIFRDVYGENGLAE